ncbi:BRO-N domain-containing protein [Sulfurospirillum sp.]|uniref:BRO-N domain-containing protein n=1 Tax=Sulfurospirillum sp. TaxID=2053622 RepID=UPI002FDD7622
MSNIQKFNFNNSQVRVVVEDGIEWFMAKDVAEVLGYRNPRDAVNKHCDEEDVVKRDSLTNGGAQSLTFINESGLYSLIFGSKLPSAKAFKKWVTSEVLPTIRKHGAYMTSDVLAQAIADPKFAVGLLQNLQEEREKRIEAEKTKAYISDKKTATAMATASVASRENERLKRQLDESFKYSTIRRQTVIHKPKEKFRYKLLRDYCKEYNLKIIDVEDDKYDAVKSYPAEAWLATYGISIGEHPRKHLRDKR